MKTKGIGNLYVMSVIALAVAAGCGDDDNGCALCNSAQSDGGSDAQASDATPQVEAGGGADARVQEDSGSESDGGEPLAIIGNYKDDWGTSHKVTAESWTQTSGGDTSIFAIEQYSNEDHYAIAHNSGKNAYNPSKWSRFDWTEKGGDLYFCQTVYDAASEAKALAAKPADAAKLTTDGCSGFPWTKLTSK